VEINYTPPPTGAKFMKDNAKMRVLMGPVGSGKSVTCSFEIVRRATMQAPNAQGIRKTRAAVVRETVRQLQDTTIKTFLIGSRRGSVGSTCAQPRLTSSKWGMLSAR
jgi:hypothetical protein